MVVGRGSVSEPSSADRERNAAVASGALVCKDSVLVGNRGGEALNKEGMERNEECSGEVGDVFKEKTSASPGCLAGWMDLGSIQPKDSGS